MRNKDRTQITQFFVLYKATDIDLKKCWIKIPKEDLLKTHPLWENKEMQAFENSLKSYLFKAVKNRCLTLINRNEVKQRIEKMIFDNLQSQYDDPDFYAIQELTEKIEEALARLPENVREAFELNRFQNLTYNEIAERLGVSPKTIDYRIQQALTQLRIDLKEYLPLLLPFLLH